MEREAETRLDESSRGGCTQKSGVLLECIGRADEPEKDDLG